MVLMSLYLLPVYYLTCIVLNGASSQPKLATNRALDLFSKVIPEHTTDEGNMSPVPAVPAMPSAVQKELFSMGGSGLVNLWEHALRLQAKEEGASLRSSEVSAVRTIVSPHSLAMMNLVPMDAPHPLYHNAPEYTALRYAFLADSFVDSDVDPQDPAIATDKGLTVKNMNGKELVFKRVDGKLSVNGVAVKEDKQLSDGTRVYLVQGLLFGHGQTVRDAFKKLMQEERQTGSRGCLGGACGDDRRLPSPPGGN